MDRSWVTHEARRAFTSFGGGGHRFLSKPVFVDVVLVLLAVLDGAGHGNGWILCQEQAHRQESARKASFAVPQALPPVAVTPARHSSRQTLPGRHARDMAATVLTAVARCPGGRLRRAAPPHLPIGAKHGVDPGGSTGRAARCKSRCTAHKQRRATPRETWCWSTDHVASKSNGLARSIIAVSLVFLAPKTQGDRRHEPGQERRKTET